VALNQLVDALANAQQPAPRSNWDKWIAALFTYLRTLTVAVLSAVLAVFTTSGHFPLNGAEWKALAWAVLLAAIPVIINAINPNDSRYGKGS
jgi:hypothetical protein